MPKLPLAVRVAALAVLATCSVAQGEDVRSPMAPGDLVPVGLLVDSQANGPSSNGNSVLEPGEAVVVSPGWRNVTGTIIGAVGAASALGGPGAPGLYTILDATATSVIPPGQTVFCLFDGGDCYVVSVGASAPRPAPHWDATLGEVVSSTGSIKTWTLHVGGSYPDVSRASSFYRFVETLLHHGVEGGCATPGAYCPTAAMTRDWMAPFVLGSREGRFYAPPNCQLGAERFADMPATDPLCRWVEELARRGVVTGCGAGSYCPTLAVSREQMAVFVLVTKEGSAYSPPACVAGSERFADVPVASPFCRWIEELARRNVVTGCGGGNYCPTFDVSREQMSVFLSVTFGLELYGARPYMHLVNSTNDVDDGACMPAHCSLREAINTANATVNPGVREEIHFRIPGTGAQTIRPAAALPGITEAVVVDGYSQPGAIPNTRGFGSGLDSVLAVELDLSAAGPLQVATSNALLRGLVVNRSPSEGIVLDGSSNAIEGCYVGTDAAGSAALANAGHGITINMFRASNRIGGTLPLQRNLISGNGDGVVIESANENLIQGNLIGTDRAGAAAIANTGSGIDVSSVTHLAPALDNVIGGLEHRAGNVISGGGFAGVHLFGYVGASIRIVANTRIQGNLIGLDASGAAPLRSQYGVALDSSGVASTLVGGVTVPAGNSIAATDSGVSMISGINGGPKSTRIQSNRLLLSQYGIFGHSGAPGDITVNLIVANTAAGIRLESGTMAIRANTITDNGGLGIDLAPAGVTPNDPGDGDVGPNDLQNFPVLGSAVSSGGLTTVTGTLDSIPNATFVIDLYESNAAHPSGFGEGTIHRSTFSVTTTGAGTAPISMTLLPSVALGHVITATATDAAGNTSEFSAAVPVTP